MAAKASVVSGKIIAAISRVNRVIALLVGYALIGCILLFITEILLREMGISLGGAEEISGYVMAGTVSWGMSYALTERAHVRIDLIRSRLRRRGKALLDLLAIISLTGVAGVIAFQCWPVLAKTLARGSTANTPLETPLWIPQALWFSGWLWFALCATALVFLTLVLLFVDAFDRADALVGTRAEMEIEP